MPEVSNKAKATLFNTAVIVSPSGYLGKYRKMYLPTHSVFEKKRYFRPGYQANVFNTEFGKLGLVFATIFIFLRSIDF
jgi:predicted amidohydrolase